jgi:4-carboxymuconolactone decarboxylase
MTDTNPRIAPLPFDDWAPDAKDTIGKALLVDGQPLNIFGTLAHHPKLLRRWLVFATHVLSKNTLPARDREIIILRIGLLCRSTYEWSQHVAIGKDCGLTDDDISAIRSGSLDTRWTPFEAALIAATDELHQNARIGDATWVTLSATYSTEQMLDVVFTIGNYNLVSMALNTCGVQLDKGVPFVPLDEPT